MEIRDSTDEWPEQIQRINKAIQKRAEEIGITEKKFKE